MELATDIAWWACMAVFSLTVVFHLMALPRAGQIGEDDERECVAERQRSRRE